MSLALPAARTACATMLRQTNHAALLYAAATSAQLIRKTKYLPCALDNVVDMLGFLLCRYYSITALCTKQLL